MRIFILPAILGLLLLLVLALFSVPARLVPGFIDEQQLRLSGVSGRALDGRAARALLRTPSGFFHLGELRWRLDPWSLLTFSPVLHLESEWSTQRGSLRVRLAGSQLRIRDLDAVVDAAVIKQALPISVSGRLELLFDELVLEERQLISAQGRLVWQDAVWQPLSGPRSLGTYVAVVASSTDGEVEAQLDTLSGNVEAKGTVVLLGQRFSTDVLVAAADSALDAELAQALSLIATPEENGYRLRLDGGVGPGQ